MTSWQTTNYKLARHPLTFMYENLVLILFYVSHSHFIELPVQVHCPSSIYLLVNLIIICLELPTSATMFHQLSQFSLNGHCMPPNSDNLHEGKAIRHGSLEKFKVMDNGVRAKKRDWSTVYAFFIIALILNNSQVISKLK